MKKRLVYLVFGFLFLGSVCLNVILINKWISLKELKSNVNNVAATSLDNAVACTALDFSKSGDESLKNSYYNELISNLGATMAVLEISEYGKNNPELLPNMTLLNSLVKDPAYKEIVYNNSPKLYSYLSKISKNMADETLPKELGKLVLELKNSK